jgi:hypothetical protein
MARLQEFMKRELCQMIAERLPPPDIKEHFEKQHGLDVSYQQIYWYRGAKQWQEFIEEQRAIYDAGVAEERFASKRVRLIACERAYLVALAKKDAKGMVLAIGQAQREMEGTRVALVDKEGEDFSFTINIGPKPPCGQVDEPKKVGPTRTLLPFKPRDDDKGE